MLLPTRFGVETRDDWQWFSKLLPSACGSDDDENVTFSYAVPLEGLNIRFLSLTTAIVSDSFHNIMTVDVERPLLFAVFQFLGTCWRFSDTQSRGHDPPCLVKLNFWWMFLLYPILTPSPATDLSVDCRNFQNTITCIFYKCSLFSSFPTFWMSCWHQFFFIYLFLNLL